MDARSYLTKTGLAVDVGTTRTSQQVLWGVLEEAKKSSLPATPSALNALYLIKVPKLSPDGSCSLHDELDPTPYDVGLTLGGRSLQNSMALLTLAGLVEAVHQSVGCEWLGVYQVRRKGSESVLVKLAARGAPSRAEFPMTEAFAATSNNVAVALSGKPRVLNDVAAHRQSGGAYYECDPKVRSEVCLPLLDPNGRVVGIVDAESHQVDYFTGPRLADLVALALECSSQLPAL